MIRKGSTVAADDLSAPLGQKKPKKPRFALPISVPQVIAGALALFVAVFAGWLLLVSDPLGGEPVVVVSVRYGTVKNPETSEPLSGHGPNRYDGPTQGTPPNSAPPQTNPKPDAQAAPTPEPGMQTVTIIDGQSGKRQHVQIPQ